MAVPAARAAAVPRVARARLVVWAQRTTRRRLAPAAMAARVVTGAPVVRAAAAAVARLSESFRRQGPFRRPAMCSCSALAGLEAHHPAGIRAPPDCARKLATRRGWLRQGESRG